MDQRQLTFLQEAMSTVKMGRQHGDRHVDAATTAEEDLALTATAARVLCSLGDITSEQEWQIILTALYVHCEMQGITRQEVQDFAITTHRMAREITELEAAA